jgi:hypothetical protein
MPTPPTDFPFQFRVCRANQDIQLITTNNTPAILNLIAFLELEDVIAEDLKILLADGPGRTSAIISLRSEPTRSQNFAYAALLECDVCGVKKGFFALFKSPSSDRKALTEECKIMSDFLTAELEKEKNLEKLSSRSFGDPYSNN